MTPAEINALSAPVSDEEPCGPDLEAIGDADYMRFIARIEVAMPQSYAKFERSSIDFPAEFAILRSLLERSRDLRLLAFLAKLHILNRDLAAFVAVVQLTETLVSARWEHLHPPLLDGNPVLRTAAIQTLDDVPDSVMPLQNAPLFETRQLGPVSYRAWLISTRQLQARVATSEEEKDEDVIPPSAMTTALEKNAEINDLVRSRGLIGDLRRSLAALESLVAEKAPGSTGVSFDKLEEMAKGVYAFLEKAVAARDPSLALEAPATAESDDAGQAPDGAPEAASVPRGMIRTQADAAAAFTAVTRYFVSFEPSSPILFLVAQAEALVGKSFFEAMQALIPEYSGQAAMTFGRQRDLHFRLPFERLFALAPGANLPPEDETSANGGSGESHSGNGEDREETTGESPPDGEDSGALPDASETASAPAHSLPAPRVRSRRDAMTLLDEIAAYFKAAEPSSPIPSLLEHAKSLAGRDFFGLLRDVLPASALRVDE